MNQQLSQTHSNGMPQTDEAIKRDVVKRRRYGTFWRNLFLTCIAIGLFFLGLLIWRVVDAELGYVAIVQKVDPATLAPKPLEDLSRDELVAILQAKISKNVF